MNLIIFVRENAREAGSNLLTRGSETISPSQPQVPHGDRQDLSGVKGGIG